MNKNAAPIGAALCESLSGFLLLCFGDRGQNFFRVMRDIHLRPHLHDLALRINEEGVALRHGNNIVALRKLQAEGAVAVDDLVVGVSQQMEGQ